MKIWFHEPTYWATPNKHALKRLLLQRISAAMNAVEQRKDKMTNTETNKQTHTEPCPNCQAEHAAGEYKLQCGEFKAVWRPDDVRCKCGALLRYTVPIFKTTADGWQWRIVEPAGQRKGAA